MNLPGSAFLRFFLVSLAGLGVDLAIAWMAAAWLGLPLPLAAATGFGVAAAFNYLLHEFWTFRDGARKVSARRGGLYILVLAATLATRVALVALLDWTVFAGTGARMAPLAIAAVLSFLVNYALSRMLVFRAAPAPRSPELR